MVRRTAEATTADTAEKLEVVACCCAGAKNSLRRRCGFSPNQWVYGKEPRLPGELCDEENFCSAQTPTESIGRRYQVRTAARRAFVEMQTCDTLKRASLGRNR
eukprot:12243541-Alexandrium_andersonii.AAC.1